MPPYGADYHSVYFFSKAYFEYLTPQPATTNLLTLANKKMSDAI
jgi:hypothetical protein